MTHQLKKEAIDLLCSLIKIESFSRNEGKCATLIEKYLSEKNINWDRLKNNIYSKNRYFNPGLPSILLNSHIDTVLPSLSYSRDPFEPTMSDDKVFGLGSNDAGASLVSLMAAFIFYYERSDLNFNLIYAATAEEEISGPDGISLLLPQLGKIDFGIVGEPTLMKMAIAEKGLIVLDCTALGTSGHAARDEGINAIYNALIDIAWFQNYKFPKISETLGEVKMNVTMIQSGSQHNVIPDTCKYVVDIRTTEMYTNTEIVSIIKQHITSELKTRSLRLNSSGISKNHFFKKVAHKLGFEFYGSPTLSDQALMDFPTIKCGPGDSSRSHMADEFVFIHEIELAVDRYVAMLESINNYFK